MIEDVGNMAKPSRTGAFSHTQREIIFLGAVSAGIEPPELVEQLAPQCEQPPDIGQTAHQIEIEIRFEVRRRTQVL